MSLRTFIQILISILIFLIIGWIYFEYFNTDKKIIEETITSGTNINQLEKKISDLEIKNKELESIINKDN